MKTTPTKPKARPVRPKKNEIPTSLDTGGELPPAEAVDVTRLRERITSELVSRVDAEAEEARVTLTPADLGVPLALYLSEAFGVAVTLAKYWRSPNPARWPSLSAFSRRLPEATIAEILHLIDRVQSSRDAARALVVRADASVVERASFVYRELRAAARFDADLEDDDGVRAEKEHRLTLLERSHEADPRAHAMLADAIAAFALYARDYADAFAAIPGLEPATVDEAVRLADALRVRHVRHDASSKIAAQTRDAYISLLLRRVSTARKVFRYAYRAHPSIVREVTSGYERTRRRRARSAAAARAEA
ncbi:MAG: hypothetical protein IPK71_13660 [Myxococcales bacterium]|nr:hypothetical protein [Myxococcales bacterium]